MSPKLLQKAHAFTYKTKSASHPLGMSPSSDAAHHPWRHSGQDCHVSGFWLVLKLLQFGYMSDGMLGQMFGQRAINARTRGGAFLYWFDAMELMLTKGVGFFVFLVHLDDGKGSPKSMQKSLNPSLSNIISS